MKIGIRVSPRTSGGGRVFVDELSTALTSSPDCETVTLFSMGAEMDGVATSQVVVPVGLGPVSRQVRGDRALARVAHDHPVDVLLSPGTETSRIPGVPTVMWPLTVAPFEREALAHLGNTPSQLVRWSLLRQSIRHSARRADAFVFSSHYARALYATNLPSVKSAPTTVIWPSTSVSADSSPVAVDHLPDSYVLFVSHLYPYKMVLEMIDAFALARSAGTLTEHLVIAGNATDPAYGRRVAARAAQPDVNGIVHLVGGVGPGQLAHLYRAAHAFIFPSASENAGSYALIDAFSFGLPVLSSSMSSMPEICQDAARYFDPRDTDHFACQLAAVLGNERIRLDLASRSRSRAGNFSGWDRIAGELLIFVGRVTERFGRRTV